MGVYSGFRVRAVSAAVSLAAALALAACATVPTGAGGSVAQQSTSDDADSTSLKGRLMLTVVDQNGQAVTRTTVEVRATNKTPYRASGVTNGDGRTEFRGVPAQVEVTVSLQSGSSSVVLDVPQTTPMDYRMVVQVSTPLPTDPGAARAGGGVLR
jgi:hypothetical protein